MCESLLYTTLLGLNCLPRYIGVVTLLDFLLRGSHDVLYRLTLAVVVGTIQSLVPANPNVIGASFLYLVYRNIHNDPLENFQSIRDFYHSGLDLGKFTEADFNWRRKYLKAGLIEQVQPTTFALS
jgi:hypothetical protein